MDNSYDDLSLSDSLAGWGWPAEISVPPGYQAPADQTLLTSTISLNDKHQQPVQPSPNLTSQITSSQSQPEDIPPIPFCQQGGDTPRSRHTTSISYAHAHKQARNPGKIAYMRQPAPHPYANSRPAPGDIRNPRKGFQHKTRSQANQESSLTYLSMTEHPTTNLGHNLPSQAATHQVVEFEANIPQHHGAKPASGQPELALSNTTYANASVQTDPTPLYPVRNSLTKRPEQSERKKPRQVRSSGPIKEQPVSRLVPLAPRLQTHGAHPGLAIVGSTTQPVGSQQSSGRTHGASFQNGDPVQQSSQTSSIANPISISTRRVQQVQGLWSPFTPDSAAYHTFSENDTALHHSRLIPQQLPAVSWENARSEVLSQATCSGSGKVVRTKLPLTPVSSFSGGQTRNGNATTQPANQPVSDRAWPNQEGTDDDRLPPIVVSHSESSQGVDIQPGESIKSQAKPTLKRKRTISLLDQDPQTGKCRDKNLVQIPQGIPESQLKPSVPQTVRSNTQPFDFNNWLVAQDSQGAPHISQVEGLKIEYAGEENVDQEVPVARDLGKRTMLGTTTDADSGLVLKLSQVSNGLIHAETIENSFTTCSEPSNSMTHGPHVSNSSPRQACAGGVDRGAASTGNHERQNIQAIHLEHRASSHSEATIVETARGQQQPYPTTHRIPIELVSMQGTYEDGTQGGTGGAIHMAANYLESSMQEQYGHRGNTRPFDPLFQVSGLEDMAGSPEQDLKLFDDAQFAKLFDFDGYNK
ncbi:hypothetical protein RhiJN_10522 [Ceratobasidium sp. AG-Ba]|nr:hypothetical protein RhiJN_10522 [Ceratobasidium sp. AG-Ba]QRW11256.1 hypothetical protein RhiLY_10255 [Ceratobasidium sp. AG-Ba]